MKTHNGITLLGIGDFTEGDLASHARYSRYFNDLVIYSTGQPLSVPPQWRSYCARPSFDNSRIIDDIRPLLRTKYVFILFAGERLLNDSVLSELGDLSKRTEKGFLVPVKFKSRNEIYWEPRIHRSELKVTDSIYPCFDGSRSYPQLACPINSSGPDPLSLRAMGRIKMNRNLMSNSLDVYDLRCYARDSLLSGDVEECIGATLQGICSKLDLSIYERIAFLNMLMICAEHNGIQDLAIEKCLQQKSVAIQSSTALSYLIKYLSSKRGALIDDDLEETISEFKERLSLAGETSWNDSHSIGSGKSTVITKSAKEKLCKA